MFQTTNQINEIPSKTHSEVNRGLSSQPIQVHTLILSPYMVGFKPAKGLKKTGDHHTFMCCHYCPHGFVCVHSSILFHGMV